MALCSSISPRSSLKSFVIWLVVPYFVGYLVSHGYLSSFIESVLYGESGTAGASDHRDLFSSTNGAAAPHQHSAPPSVAPQQCDRRFRYLLGLLGKDEVDAFQQVSFVLHRNGEPTPCGQIDFGEKFLEALKQNYMSFEGGCLVKMNKYQVESLLTKSFHTVLSDTACHSLERYGDKTKGFLGFCDSGENHTPILLDHKELVPVASQEGATSLPCRFHTREGLRISALDQITEMIMKQNVDQQCQEDTGSEACQAESGGDSKQKEIHLYAVPAGRVFMFAPAYVGEIFHLPHVPGAGDNPIYLEVLSLEPRVFDVFNFFSREESKELVDRAIAETKESHRIKRSTTGASTNNVNSRRTSESGFDTNGKTAVKVKKRCFKALGFDEYWESHADGLQILRYNISKAYNSHLDWIEDNTGQLEHDYESGGVGGNRFATILMYMSDLEEEDGGETVFPKAWPPNLPEEQRLGRNEILEQLRISEYGNVLERGSWEEDLVVSCRSKLSVRPHSSRAVLFYSQYPNGDVDPFSLHGACPVLNKQKYAANLWVWNTPRSGYAGAPIKEKFRKNKEQSGASSPSIGFLKIVATFHNSGNDPNMKSAELFYEDSFWGKLGPDDPPLAVNTYQGHNWNIKVGGKVVKALAIQEKDGEKQTFTI
mmetsp:Transcript_5099/g.9028  ORF Transcript_5099/g.9028 Transcript_5099/m.9028 type:complete len:653 (-) Transcript_5099:161-2119(-)